MANPHERQRRPWTVLIYMVADDPQGGELFDQFAHRELDRIVYGTFAADRGDSMYVAAQVDFRSQPFVWRRIIGEGTWLQPESDAADPVTLYGFFRWAVRMCPAERYMLVFWGHSAGPFGLFSDDDVTKYVAQTLTLNELRDALQEGVRSIGAPFDLVAFKDCCMSTLETVGELRDLATYVLASQALVPAEGWPYKDIFKALTRSQDLDTAVRRAAAALEVYYSHAENRNNQDSVPYSLLDTRKIQGVQAPLKALVHHLNGQSTKREGDPLRQAVKGALLGDERAMVDVKALCAALSGYGDKSVRDAAQQLATVVDALVVHRSGTVGLGGVNLFCYPPDARDQQQSHIASNASADVYRALKLTTDTGWSKIALDAMPPVPQFIKERLRSVAAARACHTNQLLPRGLQQLQAQAALEQMQIQTFDLTRRAMLGLGKGFNLSIGFDPKGFNLETGDSGKGFNLEAAPRDDVPPPDAGVNGGVVPNAVRPRLSTVIAAGRKRTSRKVRDSVHDK